MKTAKSLLLAVVLSFAMVSTVPVGATTPRASCDGVFHWLYVAGAQSLDGSQTGFEYLCRTGSPSSPLLIYMDPGGACWSGDTCDCQPDQTGLCTSSTGTIMRGFFDEASSDEGLTWAQSYWGGASSWLGNDAAAFAGPNSPFKQNWNIIQIPYSTGDAFTGDAVRLLTSSSGRTYTAYFVGHENVKLDLRAISSLFPRPDEVVVWGASAGAVGADCNLNLFRATWPDVRMLEFSNGGPAYGAAGLMPLFPNVAQTWGAWQTGPDGEAVGRTCPVSPLKGDDSWNMGWVERYNAEHLRSVAKAFSDDYSDYAVDFFACQFGATPDKTGSCASAVAATLKYEFNHVIKGEANYKVYYHTGTCHTERENDGNSGILSNCDFDKMKQFQDGQVQFNEWVSEWVHHGDGWINVL